MSLKKTKPAKKAEPTLAIQNQIDSMSKKHQQDSQNTSRINSINDELKELLEQMEGLELQLKSKNDEDKAGLETIEFEEFEKNISLQLTVEANNASKLQYETIKTETTPKSSVKQSSALDTPVSTEVSTLSLTSEAKKSNAKKRKLKDVENLEPLVSDQSIPIKRHRNIETLCKASRRSFNLQN